MLPLTRNCVIYHCQDSFWIIFPTTLLKILNVFEQMDILVILNVLSGLKKMLRILYSVLSFLISFYLTEVCLHNICSISHLFR